MLSFLFAFIEPPLLMRSSFIGFPSSKSMKWLTDIIPLAKKLDDCKVFGVSSAEYLNYAIANRREWEQRGQEIVANMVEKVTNNTANAEK